MMVSVSICFRRLKFVLGLLNKKWKVFNGNENSPFQHLNSQIWLQLHWAILEMPCHKRKVTENVMHLACMWWWKENCCFISWFVFQSEPMPAVCFNDDRGRRPQRNSCLNKENTLKLIRKLNFETNQSCIVLICIQKVLILLFFCWLIWWLVSQTAPGQWDEFTQLPTCFALDVCVAKYLSKQQVCF